MADLCVDGAGKTPPRSRVAGCVLEAETGLVSLSHLLSGGDVQQVIVTEGLHAVEMSAGAGGKYQWNMTRGSWNSWNVQIH